MGNPFEDAARAALPAGATRTSGDYAALIGAWILRGRYAAAVSGWAPTAAVGEAGVATGAALSASSLWLAGAIAAPAVSAYLGFRQIIRAREQGEANGLYNSFLSTFCGQVVYFSKGRTDHPAYPSILTPELRSAARSGRNAAVRVLNDLTTAQREEIFSHYRRKTIDQGVHEMVENLGGYRI
ncbi:MAG: hypothetical protein AAF941_04850 [Pseudomonadota bacterium]